MFYFINAMYLCGNACFCVPIPIQSCWSFYDLFSSWGFMVFYFYALCFVLYKVEVKLMNKTQLMLMTRILKKITAVFPYITL